jgi:hypothetical protein
LVKEFILNWQALTADTTASPRVRVGLQSAGFIQKLTKSRKAGLPGTSANLVRPAEIICGRGNALPLSASRPISSAHRGVGCGPRAPIAQRRADAAAHRPHLLDRGPIGPYVGYRTEHSATLPDIARCRY